MKRLFLIVFLLASCAAYSKHYEAKIETSVGDIVVKLYNDTPLHRDNFIKLARNGFYDSLLFHRSITSFMIQAGDPASKTAIANQHLGDGDVEYTIPSEIIPNNYHRAGALAAARTPDEINPERRSSGAQFYITVAPAPHLNGSYTVYGQVTSGLDVAVKISRVGTNSEDRPKKDIRIKTITIYERED